MGRLIVVSNRVASPADKRKMSGGLAVGVLGALEKKGGLWFGWSGKIVADNSSDLQPNVLQTNNIEFVTVALKQTDYEQYYRNFSNNVLWPVCHYRHDLIHYNEQDYAGYRRVNYKLAKQLMPFIKPDDLIWIHDYHLFAFAEALRSLGVRNRIGFFLHIPFPEPQVWLTIASHTELIKALCHNDLIGFQTATDKQAFQNYIERHTQGIVYSEDYVAVQGRKCQLQVYPIGIFPDEMAYQAAKSNNKADINQFRQTLQNKKLIVSVDRLDYSKGIMERFHAFEHFLENENELNEEINLLQIATETRSDIAIYQKIKRELESAMGKINGRFSKLTYAPIQYLNRSFNRKLLTVLFRMAHVGFVTPLRDGMNLVAKEFVASQNPQNPGVLILSCFAGAAAELETALIVNPFNKVEMSKALKRALNMSLNERLERYHLQMDVLRKNNLGVWRDNFLRDLNMGNDYFEPKLTNKLPHKKEYFTSIMLN